MIDFIRQIGPDAHVLAICQPTVAALAAVALMAAGGDPAQPASLTLMAGPIDCRVNPTKVNALATSQSIEWFARNLISVVPAGFVGAQRCVYPGFMQVGAFMSMNPDRHAASFADLYYERAKGDPAKADTLRHFYDEYFATADLTAEFYLETVEKVFQQYALARGELTVGDRLVEPAAIHRTALLTIEGEKDDICAVGQTMAAQELCSGLPPYLKTHHVQTGAGHYGCSTAPAGKRRSIRSCARRSTTTSRTIARRIRKATRTARTTSRCVHCSMRARRGTMRRPKHDRITPAEAERHGIRRRCK